MARLETAKGVCLEGAYIIVFAILLPTTVGCDTSSIEKMPLDAAGDSVEEARPGEATVAAEETNSQLGSCESPRRLGAFELLGSERLDLGLQAPRCSPITLEHARFFKVTIPGGHTLKAQVTGQILTSGEPSLVFMQLHGSCDDSQCLAADAEDILGGRKLTFANNGTGEVNALLSLGVDDSAKSDTRAALTVEIRHPSLNATCGTATPVTDGVLLENETFEEDTPTPRGACMLNGDGVVLFYKATLLPKQSITATVSRAALRPFFNPSLSLFGGCGNLECLATQYADGLISYVNSSDGPRNVVLAVASHGKFAQRQRAESFNLKIKLSTP